MKHYIILFQFVSIVLLQGGLAAENGENNDDYRKWIEIGTTLYRIEPREKYSWKQAAIECKRERSNLIEPQGAYDYSQLYNLIKQNFQNFSSFWTNDKVKVPSLLAQIGFSKNKQLKCNKFENTTFRYGHEECEKPLGFICEKDLMNGPSDFYNKDKTKKYYIQPENQFLCQEAFTNCKERDMSLIRYDDFAENTLMQDYIDLHYGSSPQFWLANKDKDNQCVTINRGKPVNSKTQFGFICEKPIVKVTISTRHVILIIFVSTIAVLAIIVFVVLKCVLHKLTKSYDSFESEIPEPFREKPVTVF